MKGFIIENCPRELDYIPVNYGTELPDRVLRIETAVIGSKYHLTKDLFTAYSFFIQEYLFNHKLAIDINSQLI